MTKVQEAIKFNQDFHNQLQQIREKHQLSDDLFDLFSEEELSTLKQNRYEKAKGESKGKVESITSGNEYQQAKEIRKQSNKLVKKLMDLTGKSKQEAEEIVYGRSEQKESIENLTKLEKENFRIDSINWKEITDPNGVKVKVNPEGDVREYLEGEQKGEQLFTKTSAIRETKKAGKKLPPSGTVFIDIIEKEYKGVYQDFLELESIKFSGLRSPNKNRFRHIDKKFYMWCDDGSILGGCSDRCGIYGGCYDYGFSVRCLQD